MCKKPEWVCDRTLTDGALPPNAQFRRGLSVVQGSVHPKPGSYPGRCAVWCLVLTLGPGAASRPHRSTINFMVITGAVASQATWSSAQSWHAVPVITGFIFFCVCFVFSCAHQYKNILFPLLIFLVVYFPRKGTLTEAVYIPKDSRCVGGEGYV